MRLWKLLFLLRHEKGDIYVVLICAEGLQISGVVYRVHLKIKSRRTFP